MNLVAIVGITEKDTVGVAILRDEKYNERDARKRYLFFGEIENLSLENSDFFFQFNEDNNSFNIFYDANPALNSAWMIKRISLDGFRYRIRKSEIEKIQNSKISKIKISSKLAKEGLVVERGLKMALFRQENSIDITKTTNKFCTVKTRDITYRTDQKVKATITYCDIEFIGSLGDVESLKLKNLPKYSDLKIEGRIQMYSSYKLDYDITGQL